MDGRSSSPPTLPQRLAMYAGTLVLLVVGSLVLGLALLGGLGAGRTVALVAVPVVLVAIVVLEVLLRRR